VTSSPKRAPYGSWASAITATAIVAGANAVAELCVDGTGEDAAVFFAESRPAEGGRTAVLRVGVNDTVEEITPPLANVRTRVHEYGGGAWWAQHDRLFYVEFADQQLRVIEPGAAPRQITTDLRDRYADLRVSPDDRWVLAVRERHDPQRPEPENTIVAIALDGSTTNELVTAADFVSNPRLSPDGATLAWIQWFHPNMPWDSTELWTASFRDGLIADARCVARDAALLQPEWSPGGDLHVIGDRGGWWRIERVGDGAELTSGERDE
jgi:hypothetical protein